MTEGSTVLVYEIKGSDYVRKEDYDVLLEEHLRLHRAYDERGMAMRDTATQVRSLYVGNEVSRRVQWLLEKIQGAIMHIEIGKPNEALEILRKEKPL